jgi:hypothetical protein
MFHRSLAAAIFGITGVIAASAAELPSRKPGLWDMKMITEGRGMPPQLMQQCVAEDTDRRMNTTFGGISKNACTKHEVKVSEGTMTVETVCSTDSGPAASRAVITGNFEQAYTVKVTTARGAAGKDVSNTTIEGKWVGPCKTGQVPGDLIMESGFKINLLNMPGALPAGR